MSANGGGAKIVLVVDDDPSLRLLCRVNLELDGHRVFEAATLSEARAQLERETPDVVLLDVHLGNDDGLDLLDEIDAVDVPTRVILMSGTSEVGSELRARVYGVIGKPFDLKRLAAAVSGATTR
jgi:DNA-binding NtrC family response regulator